jgi:hypothetical protein
MVPTFRLNLGRITECDECFMPGPGVLLSGTRELFTKIATEINLELSSTWGRAVQRSGPRLERVSGAFVFGGQNTSVALRAQAN